MAATGHTVLLSIHGEKGRGHRLVILFDISAEVLPTKDRAGRAQELVDVSLLNVALSRWARGCQWRQCLVMVWMNMALVSITMNLIHKMNMTYGSNHNTLPVGCVYVPVNCNVLNQAVQLPSVSKACNCVGKRRGCICSRLSHDSMICW